MNLSDITPDKLLAWLTSAASLVILVVTQFGKSRDTHFERLESERTRVATERDKMAERLAALGALREADSKRIDALEQELAFYKIERKELLTFLDDVSGGSFDHEWCKRRATELKGRYNV